MPVPAPLDQIILALPAFNEAESIGSLLDQAVEVLKAQRLPWRIIVVDDGSRDTTAAEVRRAREKEPGILLIQHEINLGLGPAIMTGLLKAVELAGSGEALVVSMDADVTHPPSIIPSMWRAAEEGADIVIASRFQPESRVVGLSLFRHMLSWGARHLFKWTVNLPGVLDYTCGFRAIRSRLLVRGFELYGTRGLITRRGFACTDELLIKLALLGPVIREVPFTLRYDLKRGKSKIKIGVTALETLRLVVWARGELRHTRASSPRRS